MDNKVTSPKDDPTLSDSDSDGYIEEFSDEVHIPDTMAIERVTTPYLTKYEKASVLGTRALQISRNAPVLINPKGEFDPLTLAEHELAEKKIPFIIRRFNGD